MSLKNLLDASSFFIGGNARELNNQGKKVRVFQTFMTNEELAERNIVVTPSCRRDEVRRWFQDVVDDQLHAIPMMHAVNLSQGYMTDSPWAKNDGVGGVRSPDLSSQIHKRIDELKSIALEEGVEISQESIDESLRFVSEIEFNLRPSIFVSANGNLRFVWDGEGGERVAFQIRPNNGEVQYVIFKFNQDGAFDHHMGLMKFSSVVSFLKGIGIFSILYRESSDRWQKVLSRTSRSFDMSAV